MKPGDFDLSTIIDPMTETLRDWARQFIAQEIHRQLNEAPPPRAVRTLTDAELRERNRLRVAHGLAALPDLPPSDKRHVRDRIAEIRARKP